MLKCNELGNDIKKYQKNNMKYYYYGLQMLYFIITAGGSVAPHFEIHHIKIKSPFHHPARQDQCDSQLGIDIYRSAKP
jgi:hypothetical protein